MGPERTSADAISPAAPAPAVDAGLAAKLACPRCHGTLRPSDDEALVCAGCAARYPFDRASRTVSLVSAASVAEKSRIRTFWGDVCRQWYSANDSALDAGELRRQLAAAQAFFVEAEHLAAVEMGFGDLAGKEILEIGSGGGAHSALFKLHGAAVIAVDITPERVLSTALKLNLLPEGRGFACEADAEHLPFTDASFDIVYSNGVLHHSTSTERCIAEVLRVLKPGGRAVLMLYCRSSAIYWLRLLPRSILNLTWFRLPEPERLGLLTEGKPKFADQPCPITRVYSRRELRRLLAPFAGVTVRKSGFDLSMIFPLGGMAIRHTVARLLGAKPIAASSILYGQPLYGASVLERLLGRWVGFDWNISARKP